MASVVGTPVAITWAAGANPASQNVTPPAGCNAVVMLWSYLQGTVGAGLLSSTLNSVAPDQVFELPDAGSNTQATGVAVWYDPPTGSAIALDVEWDVNPTEGPLTGVVFVQDADTAGYRDADAVCTGGPTQQSITLTTVSGDLVIVLDQRYLTPEPSTEAGYTSILTMSNNSQFGRVRTIVASGATQTAATQDTNYSSVVGVVIPDASGGISIPVLGASLRMMNN